MAQPRKIDELTTSAAEVTAAADVLRKQIGARADEMLAAVDEAIAARQEALSERRRVLVDDIKNLQAQKLAALSDQMSALTAVGEEAVIFSTDAVMTFDIPEDILPNIGTFGSVGEASTYANNSTAAGPALVALKEGRPSFFWVNAFDRVGQRRTKGGDDVKVQLDESFVDVSVEDSQDGRYKISFLPTVAQPCDCSVTINGEMAAGFPLALIVRSPTQYSLIGSGGEKATYLSKGEEVGQVNAPVGAVLDPTCTQCLIADSANHRIQVFDVAGGAPLHATGKLGKGRGQFSCPSSVCVLQQNNAVRSAVTDMLNHRVHIYEGTTGKWLRTMGQKGSGDGELMFPRGIAANEDGELFVCDQGNHRIVVFSVATGMMVRKFGTKGTMQGQFNTPLSVAVDVDGRILVTDKNHRVQVFDPSGVFILQWGKRGRKDGDFNYPSAVAVDDEGSVFVCDSSNSRVQIFTPEGKFIHKWGGKKLGAPEPVEGEGEEEPKDEDEPVDENVPWEGMKKPMGIALARDGTIWVVDHDLNQVLVYS